VLGALLYMAIGVAVGHSGLEQPGDLVQVLFLIFMIGVLVAGVRGRDLAEIAGG
jgi:uncharacterized membrane protein YoaK (UPF0700 family)